MQKLIDGVLVEMTVEEIQQFMHVDPLPITPAPTKEELLAQLQALQQQIQSLE